MVLLNNTFVMLSEILCFQNFMGWEVVMLYRNTYFLMQGLLSLL